MQFGVLSSHHAPISVFLWGESGVCVEEDYPRELDNFKKLGSNILYPCDT